MGRDLSITLKETEAFAHPVIAELRKRLAKYPAAVELENIADRGHGEYDVYPCDWDEPPLTGDMLLVEATRRDQQARLLLGVKGFRREMDLHEERTPMCEQIVKDLRFHDERPSTILASWYATRSGLNTNTEKILFAHDSSTAWSHFMHHRTANASEIRGLTRKIIPSSTSTVDNRELFH